MKNYLLLLSFIIVSLTTLSAQDKIQWSNVREQNSNKRPIPNAQVIFSDAAPASSDQNGKLRLAFKDKKPGAYVFLTEVQKAGYELVNNKEIEQVKIGEGDQLGVNIILAKVGIVDAAKKEYYNISDQALKAGFEREKAKLRNELQTARLTALQFEQKIEQLEKDYESHQKELGVLAEKFARVNFDDVTPVYKEALELFKAGKIDAAISKLESVNPAKRTATIIKEQKRIISAQAELDNQKVALEKEKRQQIANLRLLADMYSLKFDPIKAEAQYDDLLRLDSTDLDILRDAADFYINNHLYFKAQQISMLIIEHPQALEWQIAYTYGYIGELHMVTGNLVSSLDVHLKLLEKYKKLYQKNPNYNFYKGNMALCYERLGLTYRSLGHLDTALFFFEERHKLAKELYETSSQNRDFKNDWAISFERLGDLHISFGDLEKALNLFSQFNTLEKELHLANPQNSDFKNILAISYEKLGKTHSLLGNLDSALTLFEERSRLAKELYDDYPINANFKNGLAISYDKLGETFNSLGDLDRALLFFNQFNILEKELTASYTQNVDFKKNLARSYERLGDVHISLGNLDTAITFFEEETKLFKELFADYPQNVDFKESLAVSYERLGDVHISLGNIDTAMTFFEEETKLFKELYITYPQNVGFKKGLAISYERLGALHHSQSNLDTALMIFENGNKLFKELYIAYPQNANFKIGLAISCSKLEDIHSSLGNFDTALTFFKEEIKLSSQLHTAFPKNVSYKNLLATSYARFGIFNYYKLKDKISAVTFLQLAEKIWNELIQTEPQDIRYQNNLNLVRQNLMNFENDNDAVFLIRKRIQVESDTLNLYLLYTTLCDTLRHRISFNSSMRPTLADALNSRAWCGFFLKKFEDVEADVREGLALNTNNKFLATNLAPALLLQNKRDLAFKEYQKWKDQAFGEPNLPTYREAFLADLEAFEKAGIIPPKRKADVEAVRKLLNEPKKK